MSKMKTNQNFDNSVSGLSGNVWAFLDLWKGPATGGKKARVKTKISQGQTFSAALLRHCLIFFPPLVHGFLKKTLGFGYL